MSDRNFRELIEAKWDGGKFVCVGLDSDAKKIPKHVKANLLTQQFWFNKAIVDATSDLVCAYKPNTAFYEARGWQGIQALQETVAYIHSVAPEVPVILDAKRADIGNTNDGYVEFAFERLSADAITVHPYLGSEALNPFLDRGDKGIFVLCRTSNPGAGEFQDLVFDTRPDISQHNIVTKADAEKRYTPLYQYLADRVANTWNDNWNCGVVVGATYPDELAAVRSIVGDMPILIPGIGAQGGEVEATVKAGADSGGRGMIINSSRGIIFAYEKSELEPRDFDHAARIATIDLHSDITAALAVVQ